MRELRKWSERLARHINWPILARGVINIWVGGTRVLTEINYREPNPRLVSPGEGCACAPTPDKNGNYKPRSPGGVVVCPPPAYPDTDLHGNK